MVNPGVTPAAKLLDTSVNNFPVVQAVHVQNFPAVLPVAAVSVPTPVTIAASDGQVITVGSKSDPVASTPAAPWTIVSLLKGILSLLSSGPPVSGTVAVSNFPATQPVSGSVAVSNFPATQPVSGTFFPATQPVSGSVSVSNLPATQPVAVTNFPATQPVSNPNLDVPLSTRLKPADTLAAIASILNPVTEKRDTGRQQVFLGWENISGSVAESVPVNFTSGSRGGTALAAASNYAVTLGKTLRIQTMTVMFGQNGSAACNYRLRIRQAAAVTNTSPIVLSASAGGPSNSGIAFSIPIPDGLEIAAGQQIGLTHIDTAAGGVFSASLVGFEY